MKVVIGVGDGIFVMKLVMGLVIDFGNETFTSVGDGIFVIDLVIDFVMELVMDFGGGVDDGVGDVADDGVGDGILLMKPSRQLVMEFC